MSGAVAVPLAPAPTTCAHCGSPIVAGAGDPSADERFCCAGCAGVWTALHEAGLGHYYALRERVPGRPFDARGARPFDEEAVRQAMVDDGRALCLSIEGIHCGSCGWVLESLAQRSQGVARARITLADEQLLVTLADGAVATDVAGRLVEGLRSAGYVARPAVRGAAPSPGASRTDLLRLGIAAAAAMNLMLLAVSMYGGDRFGMDWADRRWFRGLSCLIAVPGVLWPAWPVITRAVAAMRARVLHVDVPLAIGIVAMMVASVVNTVRGRGELWFDSAAMLVALLLGGRFVEASLRRRAAGRLRAMLGRRAPRARRLGAEGVVEDVASERLRLGDAIELLPGDVVPADVVIERGASDVDASIVDGESRPRLAQRGDTLASGARVLDGALVGRVVAEAAHSTLARLRQQVDRALSQRHETEVLADRVARWFVAAVLVLSAAGTALWWGAGPERAMDVGVAVLVVACPCALALATPLVFAASVHAALGRGALVRHGGAILDLAEVGTIVFDRTGTLTEGVLRPGAFRAANGWDDRAALRLAAAVARASRHPVSRAVVQAARERDSAPLPLAVDIIETAGQGIRGRVDGHDVWIGRPGATVSIDGIEAGELELRDAVRPAAYAAVSALRGLGLRVELFSGDRAERVEALARSVGADLGRGAMLPEDKAREIAALEAVGVRTAFVGDGLNDGPALARATVGFAMGEGVDLAVEAGRGVLLDEDPGVLPDLVRLGRRARWVLRTNLAFSALYNLVAVVLATSGVVTPLLAASLMPVGSLVVVARAARLSTFLADDVQMHRPQLEHRWASSQSC